MRGVAVLSMVKIHRQRVDDQVLGESLSKIRPVAASLHHYDTPPLQKRHYFFEEDPKLYGMLVTTIIWVSRCLRSIVCNKKTWRNLSSHPSSCRESLMLGS